MNILFDTGFESLHSIEAITKESIDEIEKYVNENRSVILNTIYENKLDFKFLPGHRALLMNLPNKVQQFNNKKNNSSKYDSSMFSFILKSLIETAESNANKDPRGNRFDEVIKHFSTYIYLLCGKACYDTLSANLPIPKSNTICK